MTRAVEVGGWEMVPGHMNERSLVTSLCLFDLVELSHGLLLQSEGRSALSWCACGLIFIHVPERRGNS